MLFPVKERRRGVTDAGIQLEVGPRCRPTLSNVCTVPIAYAARDCGGRDVILVVCAYFALFVFLFDFKRKLNYNETIVRGKIGHKKGRTSFQTMNFRLPSNE